MFDKNSKKIDSHTINYGTNDKQSICKSDCLPLDNFDYVKQEYPRKSSTKVQKDSTKPRRKKQYNPKPLVDNCLLLKSESLEPNPDFVISGTTKPEQPEFHTYEVQYTENENFNWYIEATEKATEKSNQSIKRRYSKECKDFEALQTPLVNKSNNAAASITIKDGASVTEKTLLQIEDFLQLWSRRKELYKFRDIAGTLTKRHRVRMCGKYPFSNLSPEIWATIEKRASYKNLIYCCSIWACPVCSSKIRRGRFDEITEISKGLQKDGYNLVFITLTKTHKLSLDQRTVKALIKKTNEDYRKITAIRDVKDLVKLYSIEYIKALEITFGLSNGFHPHLHVVLAFKHELCDVMEDGKYIGEKIIKYWLRLNPSADKKWQDAQIVKNEEINVKIDEYITKMDLAYEMTNKTGSKRGKKYGHFNPIQIPEMIHTKDYQGCKVTKLKHIYACYVQASKGSRFMTYSRGLKDKYVKPKTDEELCNDTTKLVSKILEISENVWKSILKHRLRADLVNLVEECFFSGTKFLSVELKELGKTIGENWEIDNGDHHRLIRLSIT